MKRVKEAGKRELDGAVAVFSRSAVVLLWLEHLTDLSSLFLHCTRYINIDRYGKPVNWRCFARACRQLY